MCKEDPTDASDIPSLMVCSFHGQYMNNTHSDLLQNTRLYIANTGLFTSRLYEPVMQSMSICD